MPPPEKQGVQRCLRWQLAPGQIALPPPPYIRVAGGGGGGKFTKSRRCQVSEKAAPIDLQQNERKRAMPVTERKESHEPKITN